MTTEHGTAPGVAADTPSELTWHMRGVPADDLALLTDWSAHPSWEWAWGGATGAGTRVCVIDSGVERDHPLVSPLAGAYRVEPGVGGELVVVEDEHGGDSSGHGTACAGIIRQLAPGCQITSIRVLGGYSGKADVLLTGLRWAIDQGFDVINLSLSTTKRQFAQALHELADRAYFRHTLLVASAHNNPVESFPWRFASVISVGSHVEPEPLRFYYNPRPPVEFFARGVNVAVAWLGGGRIRCTGNSFATPHMAGICALIKSKHPQLTPFQIKTLLYLTAANVKRST